jgi:hypothetical protein
MSPQQPVASVIDAKKQFGFSGIPVTETGEMGGRLVGLITQRDIDFLTPDEHNRLISEVTIAAALHFCYSLRSMIRHMLLCTLFCWSFFICVVVFDFFIDMFHSVRHSIQWYLVDCIVTVIFSSVSISIFLSPWVLMCLVVQTIQISVLCRCLDFTWTVYPMEDCLALNPFHVENEQYIQYSL